MKTIESSFPTPGVVRSFLDQAASAGVVSGCGTGAKPAFDPRELAVAAVTDLYESREAVEARLSSARQEFEVFDSAGAEAPAGHITLSAPPGPLPEQRLLARFLGWFRRLFAFPPAGPSTAPVSRAEMVRQVRLLEARSRELLAIENSFANLFGAEFNSHRARVKELPLDWSRTRGGK
jgi:hypothetical protein